MLIGITGKIGSGKSRIAKHIETKYGYHRLSTSDLLKSILKSKDIEQSRENLQDIGDNVIKMIGGSGFMAIMFVYLPQGNYQIDSIRHLEALQYMKKKYGHDFVNIFVDTTEVTRYSRTEMRYESFEHFKKIDSANTEKEIELIKSQSDFIINNENSFPEVLTQIDVIYEKISQPK
jgi:dephospho-CoA kinase